MSTLYTRPYRSPLGELTLESDGAALVRIRLPQEKHPAPDEGAVRRDDAAPFAAAVAQLDEYFAGKRRSFDLPLAPTGTAFQKAVWRALLRIPYGRTTSYGALADQLGKPTASRAVGAANGRNPLPIVVPCHRVIGSSGRLTGYAGGLEAKRTLLELEGALAATAG